jgi:hypothetical protein
MTRRTVEVVVNTDGMLEIEAVGFNGADCEKATRFLDQALGVAKSRKKKPEYYRRAKQQQSVST